MKDDEKELVSLIENVYGMKITNIDFKLEDDPRTSKTVHCHLIITGTKTFKNIV
ncbi:MAG: hypothetical protein ACE5J5_00340 [Candidatus Hydrothermarchaeales archaeon]